MLLLVTILLVLVAAVTLLIGIFSDNLALIFISIGASALAAIVLAVLSQVSKRKGREATASSGPEPLPAREAATVGGRQAEQAASDIADIGEPVGVPSDSPTTTMSTVGAGGLPIADYDTLRVNQILPALVGLDLDQLEAVAQHEESNKNRTTVLNRIDDLMDELEAQESSGSAATAGDLATEAVESIETVGEPVVAAASSSATTSAAAASGFPIPDYDDLDEDELIERLEDLDADQLEAVADREEAGQNRDAVLDAIDDRLDILEGIVPAPPAKAPAKKATAKKKAATPPTATRKATTPTPVKRAAAKKATSAPAKRAAATPAKKAAGPAKRTAAAAAPAKKAPAKKAAATATKATKKAATTAKKAAPVKKATAAKKTSKR